MYSHRIYTFSPVVTVWTRAGERECESLPRVVKSRELLRRRRKTKKDEEAEEEEGKPRGRARQEEGEARSGGDRGG